MATDVDLDPVIHARREPNAKAKWPRGAEAARAHPRR